VIPSVDIGNAPSTFVESSEELNYSSASSESSDTVSNPKGLFSYDIDIYLMYIVM